MDSARMTEANILIDICLTIKQRYRTYVTIIPVSRMSDVKELLIKGPIIFFQFSTPYSYSSDRNNNFTKYVIEMKQHQSLLQCFRPTQAFYVFAALNSFGEIISNRKDFMKYCIALDVHGVPTDIRLDQKTRVVRMVKSSLSPKLEIAGRRKFEAVANLMTLEGLINNLGKGVAGIFPIPGIASFKENFKNFTQRIYAIHLGTEFAAAS
jgi:hypothetical protein